MTPQSFTIGVYENLWVYVRLLAAEAQKLIKDGHLDKVQILWYKLCDPDLLNWLKAVEDGSSHMHPYPFGNHPLVLELTGRDDEIPGLGWTGQQDMPEALIKKNPAPGYFGEVNDIYRRSLPNVIVVDHHLFDLDTTGLVMRGSGHAHVIVQGLREYCGGLLHTPPIFLSSQKSLAGTTGLDTLGLGRSQGARVSWFPRPQGDQPTDLPDGFAQALREEVSFWLRNRDVLGTIHEDADWHRYDPPFEHIVIYYDSIFSPDKDAIEKVGQVVFQDQVLAYENAGAVMARHCKAYLEVQKEVTQEDVNRLRKLAGQYPLPIVLLYWNTAPNVCNLADCGVMAHLVEGPDAGLGERMQSAAIEWTRRMAALDTVVGGERLREIRDYLLRWRLSTQPAKEALNKSAPGRQGMLVVGRTGAGKTAISKWCHFYSNHIAQDDETVRDLWKEIPVPHPDQKQKLAVPLHQAFKSTSKTGFLYAWANTLLAHSHSEVPEKLGPDEFMDAVFKSTGWRPWQVNLVGVTGHDEFVMQMAGAFPSWTGAEWPRDWRPGAILDATNNSLILNEIGELENEAQGLLLELIERNGPIRPRFAPIGGEVVAKNVLFIMATDRVDRIREQLLHRCRIVRVPSLLECQEDIPELARHRLLPRWCCLSERAEQLLKGWPYWPGNHRSLHAVLDVTAEQMPSYRRVIRVPDVIRALWREDLIRIPTRLESLIKWILEWPELDMEGSEGQVLPQVISNLAKLPEDKWTDLVETLNRIAKLVLENPSAHFTHFLHTKNDEQPEDKEEFLSTAIGVLVHEVFSTVVKRTDSLEAAIKSAKKARDERLYEIAGNDFERRLVMELRDDALVTLSLGTLLWRVLDIRPAEIKKANDLLNSRDRKLSGRHPESGGEGGSEDQAKAAEKRETLKTGKKSEVRIYGGTKISQTISSAGRFSLAVVKAVDSPVPGSLFDYADDRRDRDYF